MNLDRIAAVLRPRSPWQAVDLGFILLRSIYRDVCAAWLIGVLPVWLVLFVALRDWPWLAILILWWLKPFFDRIPLALLGPALFGDRLSLPAAVRSLPRLLLKAPLAGLILYRADIARSYHLPVWHLEGMRGAKGFRRVRLLSRRQNGTAITLTFVCWLAECCLLVATISLALMMVPEHLEVAWGQYFLGFWTGDAHWWCYPLVGGAWFLAVTLVEPFYVAAGFALYINRRVALEGWDIEVAFRRLASRLEAPEPGSPAARDRRSSTRQPITGRPSTPTAAILVLAAAGALASLAAAAQPAAAQPAAAQPTVDSRSLAAATPAASEVAGAVEATPGAGRDPAVVVQEILDGPDFTRERSAWRWVPRHQARLESDSSPAALSAPAGFAARAVATLSKVLLWLAAGWILSMLLFHLLRAQGSMALSAAPRPRRVQQLFGLELHQQALPDDIAGEARRLLHAGRLAEALSLLYRGALARLVSVYQADVEPSWTEQECLRFLDHKVDDAQLQLLRSLTQRWSECAYAHRAPEPAALDELCVRWDETFGAAS
jgi:hypothetical protein